MAKSTADCKKFIVSFLTKHPSIVESYFPGDLAAKTETLREKNWKREYKRLAGNEEYDEYSIMNNGDNLIGTVTRWGLEYGKKMSPDKFVFERRFDCQPFEGQLAFLILEDANGELYFSDYVGD